MSLAIKAPDVVERPGRQSRLGVMSAVLLVAAVPCMRPFLYGERYSPIGIGLVAGASLLATAADHRQPRTSDPAGRSVLLWTATLWAWVLVLLGLHAEHPPLILSDAIRGVVDVPIVLAGAFIVLRDHERRTLVTKAMVGLLLVLCASFVVTFALWVATGFAMPPIRWIAASYYSTQGIDAPTPVYFPITPTQSWVSYSGVLIPRLLGLGREPGIMGAAVAWAYFMLPRLGWKRRRFQWLLVAGLLGSQSTAGLGVFLAVLAISTFLIPPPHEMGTITGVARQFLGVGVIVAAVWLAVAAPGFGLAAKSTANPVSVSDRQDATMNGLRSALDHPFGDPAGSDDTNSGVNVLAAARSLGIVGSALSLMALCRPLVLSRARKAAVPSVLVLVGTALTAQPLLQSTGLFLLVLLSVGRLNPDPLAVGPNSHGLDEHPSDRAGIPCR